MAARGTAVVPTLVNVANFPGFAAAGEAKFPAYASTMRRLHASSGAVVRAAFEAGVPVFAGTDAGGGIDHGVIADEIRALHAAGLPRRGGAGRRVLGGAGVAGPAGPRGGRRRRPGRLRRGPARRPRRPGQPRAHPPPRPGGHPAQPLIMAVWSWDPPRPGVSRAHPPMIDPSAEPVDAGQVTS